VFTVLAPGAELLTCKRNKSAASHCTRAEKVLHQLRFALEQLPTSRATATERLSPARPERPRCAHRCRALPADRLRTSFEPFPETAQLQPQSRGRRPVGLLVLTRLENKLIGYLPFGSNQNTRANDPGAIAEHLNFFGIEIPLLRTRQSLRQELMLF